MDVKELQQLDCLPEEHWYYRSKFDLLASTVDRMGAKHVADIGAGSGVFARLLLQHTACQAALCIDPAYDRDHDEQVGSKTLRFRRSYADVGQIDLVLMMDVLEHVDDDAGLLADAASKFRPGTPVFITVPAFQALWSAHDVFLEHRRRYTAGMLGQTIRRAGLRPEWTRYFYASILPLVAAVRLLRRGRDPEAGSDLRPTPKLLGWLLTTIMGLERRALFPLNRVGGLSVVALVRT